MKDEIIDAAHTVVSAEIVPVQPSAVPVPRYFQDMRPAERISHATEMADALKAIIDQKKLGHKLNSRNPDDEFVELEAWQTCGALCGMSAKVEWVRPIDDGFEARAVIVRVDTGIEVGAAESRCTRSEGGNWGRAKDFALSGMASTRAQSRAFRGILAWILVLAGYKPTPAEEMPNYAPSPSQPKAPTAARADDAKDRERKALLRMIHTSTGERGMDDETYRELVFSVGGNASLAVDEKSGRELPTARNLGVEQLKALLAAVEGA